jgi:aspartate/methionine/tyrosine aminotransferase
MRTGTYRPGMRRIETFELAEWVTKYTDKIQHDLTNSSIQTPTLSEMGIRPDYDGFQAARPSLRGVLNRTLAKTFNVPEDEILVTCGGSEALFLAIVSTIQRGDDVVATVPNYAPIFKIPGLIGARVRFVESRFEDEFLPDIQRLQEALSSETKLLILTNSNNPSGRKLNGKMLEEIMNLAGETTVVVDEAFREFGFEDAPPVAATLSDNCLSLGTMSKFYGLGDLRIGWIMGNRSLIERARKLKYWTTIDNSVYAEMVASKVLEEGDSFVDRAHRFYAENVRIVEDWISSRDDLEWVKPDGGLVCFPKFKIPLGSIELARRLVVEHSVAIGPGTYFNMEGHFRLCFTRSSGNVREALNALGRGLDAITTRP